MKSTIKIVASVLVLALSGAAHAADVKIGMTLPLTGFGAKFGEDARRGAELAVAQANAAGGIKGDKIDLIVEDDAGTGKDGIASIRKLAGTDKVPVVVAGTMSTTALTQAPIAREAKIAYLATMSSHPDLTSPGGFIYRMSNTDALACKVQADYAVKELKAKTGAALFSQSDYGTNSGKMVRAAFEKAGGKWVGQDDFKMGATDFKTQIAKLKELNPDVLFIVTSPKEASQLFRQMTELNFRPAIMGTSLLDDPEIFALAGDTANGVYFESASGRQTPETAKLRADYVAAFKAKYGTDPGITANTYYDATRLAIAAITAVGPDGPAIDKWVAGLKDFPGVVSAYSFNKIGDAILPIMIKKIVDKKYTETGYSEE